MFCYKILAHGLFASIQGIVKKKLEQTQHTHLQNISGKVEVNGVITWRMLT